jgi:hypothetical protein
MFISSNLKNGIGKCTVQWYTLGTHSKNNHDYKDSVWVVRGTIFAQFFIFLRDLRSATRLEAGASVFDLGPRSTVQSQLHDFWVHMVF